MGPKDWLVTTGVRDESVLDVLQLENTSPFVALVPLFGTEGDDNTFVHFKSGSFFKDFYGGDEIMDVKKFGQSALNGYQVLNGGGEVIGYRLAPNNAKRATSLLSLHVKADAAIPLWQREANGAFKLDASKAKIAVDDPGNPGNQLTAAGHIIKLVTTSVDDVDAVTGEVGTAAGGWTTYPLFLFSHTAKGACGKKYGITLSNDILRDKATSDGRRYMLNLWKKKPSGDSALIAETVRFALNPLAEQSPNSKVSEYVENVYPQIDNSGRKNRIQMKFFADNVTTLQNLLLGDLASGGANDLDFIFGNNKFGYPYDKIVVDPTSNDITTSIEFLQDGHDGSLEVGATVPDPDGAEGSTLTVTAAMVTAAKKQLLIDFFNCDLNQEILDARIVDAGHVFDAGYDSQVKSAMIGGLNVYRPDIHIWVDLGHVKTAAEGIAAYAAVGNMIPALTSYNFSVIGFAGYTKEGRPQAVTGTYEMARKIPKSYVRYGWFVPMAGYFTGELEFMTTNFVVSMTKDDMIGKYKDAAIIFPRKLSRDNHIAIMGEETQYVTPTSKLKSSRNAGVVEDAQRVAIRELPKYAFDPEGAESSIKRAKEDLTAVFSSRYPKNVKVELNIYQDNYDKSTNNAHCQIIVTFPDVLETFTVEVVARRNI